jgi:putative hydrolase of the HAD superfamily
VAQEKGSLASQVKTNCPSGIIFDFGDTILHIESFEPLVGNRRLVELASVNPGLTAGDVQAAFDEFRWMDRARDASMIEYNCQALHRIVFETLGISFPVSYAETEREFWHASVKFAPVAGIYGLLDALEDNGIKTGILSNTLFSGSVLKEELEKHNLAHRFSFVVTSADYAVRKPHPYIFRLAVRKMALEPADVWFVGDKQDFDIKGALDSGLYPVWLNWRGEPKTLDGDYLEVGNLDELTEKIRHLIPDR